jgi:hypothetical protein
MIVAHKTRVVLATTALAGLAAVGGVSAVLGPDTSAGSTGTRAARINVTQVATTSSSPSSNAAMTQLMAMLPKGWDSSNCGLASNAPQDALATLQCGRNSLPNGPTSGRFSIYPDQATLDTHFANGASADTIAPCPNGAKSPGTWHSSTNPNQTGGQVVCGTYNGNTDLQWSDNARLFLGDLSGTDINSLYQFWANST